MQRATSAANEKLKRLKGHVAELSEEEEEFLDYMDEDMTPPTGCENWIATFAQDAFDKVIKPHKTIANFILSKCYLKIS